MIGCDIVKINRMEAFTKNPERLRKILTEAELALYERRRDKEQFLAGRWAAKEAVAKLFGGIIKCPPDEVEILPDETGAPGARLLKRAAQEHPGVTLSVSISHDGEYAMAVAMVQEGEENEEGRIG